MHHWAKHKLVRVIPEDYSFSEVLKRVASLAGNSGKSIEVGGFPGSFSIYLAKHCGMDATLIDYYIDRNVIDSLLQINELPVNSLQVIEADVFEYEAACRFDIVCSFGFIEHFDNLDLVLSNHLKLLKPGALLLVTLPNFRGVNGLLQKIFDPGNLALHNLNFMDVSVLKNTLHRLGMQDIEVEYYPSAQVWLEGLRDRNFFVRAVVRIVGQLVSLLARAFGSKSQWFSSSIVAVAKKPLEQK